MGYRKRFIVHVTLTPGSGYKDSRTPDASILRDAIRNAFARALAPSGYIAGRATSVRPVIAAAKAPAAPAGRGKAKGRKR